MVPPGHAFYAGTVGHARYLPKEHQLAYPLGLFWLELTQLDTLPTSIRHEQFGAFSLRRRDYLRDCPELAAVDDLAEAVRLKAAALGADLTGVEQIFLLSPLANWGLYFSPLTQFYLYRDGKPCYLLAEVSNTPWNQRHCYLVPLKAGVSEFSHAKNFHVSPFNPLDMQYHWQIEEPAEQLQLQISNYRAGEKVFSAWYRLSRQPLSAQLLHRRLIRSPWPNVTVVLRIYWQALKLICKGMPFYSYQKPKDHNA